MPREHQAYEDVMDVKLRWTLKELGFKRKSYASYIFKRPKVDWLFELHLPVNMLSDFYDMAGVLNHEMERVYTDVLKRHFIHYAGMRNPAHAAASITQLVRIERGWDSKAWLETHPDRKSLFGEPIREKAPDVSRVLEFNEEECWRPVDNPWGESDSEVLERIYRERVAAFGPYLDDMFRRYTLPWYRMCDDPLRFARWYERHESWGHDKDLGTITAYCLAGEMEKARELILIKIEESEISYQEILDGRVRTGWRRWLHGRSLFWGDDPEESARGIHWGNQEAGKQTRVLARAFAISL